MVIFGGKGCRSRPRTEGRGYNKGTGTGTGTKFPETCEGERGEEKQKQREESTKGNDHMDIVQVISFSHVWVQRIRGLGESGAPWSPPFEVKDALDVYLRRERASAMTGV